MNTEEFTVLPTDGPLLCIWKVMHGKGWIKFKDLLQAASAGSYTEAGIRRLVYGAPEGMLERKDEPRPDNNKPQTFYRLVEGFPRPQQEVTRTTKKLREEKKLRDAERVMNERKAVVKNPTPPIDTSFPRWML